MRCDHSVLSAALALPLLVAGQSHAASPIDLGTAGAFEVLAKSGISTTSGTEIVGDIGVSPIDSTGLTGFGLMVDPSGEFSTSSLVTGNVYASDYAPPTPANLSAAIGDMQTAYTATPLDGRLA